MRNTANVSAIGVTEKRKPSFLKMKFEGSSYTGAAHGIVGCLYMLIKSVQMVDVLGLDELFCPTIKETLR